MRGAGFRRRSRPCDTGIIPAHAGSSGTATASTSAGRDHPRACGEQVDPVMLLKLIEGSSPRMRGAGPQDGRAPPVQGIIPAHAGSRLSVRLISMPSRDHPRACGEQHRRQRPRVELRGIIPAHAGSSVTRNTCPSDLRDHPRACGEQLARRLIAYCGWGSSPRMRGAERLKRRLELLAGIIPAHAGSRIKECSCNSSLRDHPRACGEQMSVVVTVVTI